MTQLIDKQIFHESLANRSHDNSGVAFSKIAFADLFALTKPTISLLVVVTVIPGILLAAHGPLPSMTIVLWTLLGTWFASASAAVLNQYIDAEIDAKMQRTKKRPLPSGKMDKIVALGFALILGLSSILILGVVVDSPLAACISLSANIFYVLIYTLYLKKRTVQNIVIGGAAGAVGPLIGWAVIFPDSFDSSFWFVAALFMIIFLWTPPHFWALALKYKDDYKAAGIPMMPVIRGEKYTREAIYWYSLSLFPASLCLVFHPKVGWTYGMGAFILTSFFFVLAKKLRDSGSLTDAMKLFHYSCFYLFGLFAVLTVDIILFTV